MRRGSLTEERPDLVGQWSASNTFSPDKVSCGSHLKVWWVCTKGHEWEAVVKNRALLGSGCPYCEHRAILKGYNDLATLKPELAKSWSPKNQRKPSEYAIFSNTEVLWICENGHEWKARIADRSEGHGCPYCAGHRVWKGYNDLASTHSSLLSEWSDKNELSPDSITFKNRSNVWWHCNKCGNDYQAVVYAKANGRVCPFCIATNIQFLREIRQAKRKIVKDFKYLLPQFAAIYYAGKCGIKVMIDSEHPIGLPVMAYIPSVRLIIDVCTSDREKKLKGYICDVNRIKYVPVPEKITEEESLSIVRKAFADVDIYSKTSINGDLEILRDRFTQLKEKA